MTLKPAVHVAISRRRVYRPWVPSPGEHLVIDWGEEGEPQIFCAVQARSGYRFVRFAANKTRETTRPPPRPP